MIGQGFHPPPPPHMICYRKDDGGMFMSYLRCKLIPAVLNNQYVSSLSFESVPPIW